jgi:hypothetical protein
MAQSDFTLIPFAQAAERLNLQTHFGDHMFDQYGEDDRCVRYYAKNAVIQGDIDLDMLYNDENVAGIFAKQDLTITGTIENWEIDTIGAFLAVGRDLRCKNLIASGADIRVRRDLIAANAVVSTYNHGYMEVSRDIAARWVIIDDHCTIVGREIKASGWKESSSAEVFDFPDSDWRTEIKAEFRDEFFDSSGDVRCQSGNVDLVKALLAERDILRKRT